MNEFAIRDVFCDESSVLGKAGDVTTIVPRDRTLQAKTRINRYDTRFAVLLA
jgi:hypothetical protein